MARALAMCLILVLAAALRFTGLDWGLRHPPFSDERVFVESVARMLAAGDLDHRFYEYPGLFFYLLAPLLALLPPEARTGPQAFILARGLVAAFSLASVGLAYLLGRRLMCPRAGLVAALLLAVSPVDVASGHMIRPDLVLGTGALLALVAFDAVGPRARADALAGAALGVAAGVKFTGVLLLPSYLVRRAAAPGARARGVLVAGVVAALVFVAATPYALVHLDEFLGGTRYQVLAHYRGRPGAPGYADGVAFYLRTAASGLGLPGALLAVGGVALAVREWRRWAGLLFLPAVLVAVMSTAELRFERFLAPVSGVLALLAARGIEGVAGRHVVAGALATLVALASPLEASVRYVRKAAAPGPRDRALDWIEAHVRPGGRILDLCRDLSLGVDRSRYEVLELRPRTARLGLVAAHADLVVAYPDVAARLAGLKSVLHVRADRGEAPFKLLVPSGARPRYEAVLLGRARLGATAGADRLEAVRDGDPATVWAVTGGGPGRDYLEVVFPEPVPVGRIELVLGRSPRPCPGDLALLGTSDGKAWGPVLALPGRPAVEAQLGAPSQVLLLPGEETRGLRVACEGRGQRAWEVAELRVETRATEAR